MPASSNIPRITWLPTGPVAPNELDILNGVLADINIAFGGNLNLGLYTPQGQLAQSLTQIIATTYSQLIELTNQLDPNYANGIWQDAIGKFYFIDRIQAKATAVECVCSGVSGTIIPVGSLAITADKLVYSSIDSGVINEQGTVNIQFQCTTTGKIPCLANTVNTIYRVVYGWETVNNPTPGIIGRDEENKQDFESRRFNSVYLNSKGGLESIKSSILNIDNVLYYYLTQNNSNIGTLIGGVTLLPHSIYVCVEGGLDSEVANAIYQNKNPGCNMSFGNFIDGNITYRIDNYYDMKFQRPEPIPLFISIVRPSGQSGLPSNINDLIKNSVINYFTQIQNKIGITLYASQFYQAIYNNVSILIISIGIESPALSNSISFNIDQIPTLNEQNITIAISELT